MFFDLVLGALCVWRITHLLQAEDGPWQIVIKLRRCLGSGFWGQLMDCFKCLSLWIAMPFALLLGSTMQEQLLYWPALSALAILLEAVISRLDNESAAIYQEEEEDE